MTVTYRILRSGLEWTFEVHATRASDGRCTLIARGRTASRAGALLACRRAESLGVPR